MNADCLLFDGAATEHLGGRLATVLRPPAILYLRGQLGAGKTTLVRGILRGLGVQGTCKSPTYTLVEPYDLPCGPVFHFDLYRLQDPEELEFIGLRDYVGQEAICLFEWPERAPTMLPPADLDIMLEVAGTGRRAHSTAATELGRQLQMAFARAGVPD